MRVAEALIEKKGLTARVNELQGRYTNSAVVEEGEQPEENAEELLVALEGTFKRLEFLSVAINTTNNVVLVGDMSLMQAIARRESLKTRIGQYSAIIGSIRQRNYSRRNYGENVAKMVLAEGVNAAAFIKQVDSMSKELRELDLKIKEINWTNDLIDPVDHAKVGS